jgi:hypothetical protein
MSVRPINNEWIFFLLGVSGVLTYPLAAESFGTVGYLLVMYPITAPPKREVFC